MKIRNLNNLEYKSFESMSNHWYEKKKLQVCIIEKEKKKRKEEIKRK